MCVQKKIILCVVLALLCGGAFSARAEGINSSDNVDLPIGAGGRDVIVIKSGSGRVGMGVADPQAQLDVNGDSITRGTQTASQVSTSGNIVAGGDVYSTAANKWMSHMSSWTTGPNNIGRVTGNNNVDTYGLLKCPVGHYVCAIGGFQQYGYGIIDLEVYCCSF